MNTAVATRTSEINGLLAAYGLDGQGGGRALTTAEIGQWNPMTGTLWLHLDFSQDDTAEFLHGLPALSPVVAEALCLDETRPRVDLIADGLLIILRAVNTNPGAEPDDMVSIRIWLEPHRIITSRRRRLKSIQDLQQNLGQGTGPSDPGSFLLQLIDRIGFRTSQTVAELEDAIDALEEQFNTERQAIPRLRGDLSNLRRQCAVLRRHIAPQRDALERLSRETAPMLSDNLRLQLREEADKFRRYVEDLDLARERAMVAHEQLQAIIAEEQNQRMFLLSIVAAIFLPLSFVTGLLGMNVGGIPGSDNPLAFTLLLVGMVAVAVALFLFFRQRRWI